jgi:hypothetical protein
MFGTVGLQPVHFFQDCSHNAQDQSPVGICEFDYNNGRSAVTFLFGGLTLLLNPRENAYVQLLRQNAGDFLEVCL